MADMKPKGTPTPKEGPINPAVWGGLVFALAAGITFLVASLAKSLLEANPSLVPPEQSVGPSLIYFFGMVVVLGVVLFLIPVSKLRLVLKALFVLMYSWGMFVMLWLTFTTLGLPHPFAVAITVAAIVGLAWFLQPRLWYHNLVLMLSLVSVGVVFGRMLEPWTLLVLLGVISVYDVLSVGIGYMMWMAKKMSESDVLPAFVFPKRLSHWNLNLKGEGFRRVMTGEAAEREFSILGGGDIGFPLMLVASVLFKYGFASSLTVAAFALLGILSAFWIQHAFLKGKPMPALPPISVASFIGFMVAYFWVG